jgi:alanyl-tRNA synthetase
MWSHDEIRNKFLEFFEKRGHFRLPSSSLIPEYDPTLLLTNSGMAPLKPYFLGQKTPPSFRLVNVQKCVRTGDIDAVGDIHHLTFFEMMGNWSIGSSAEPFGREGRGPYFKKEACEFAFELLNEFGINQDKLYFGIFAGDPEMPGVPSDDETKNAWLSLGVSKDRIVALSGKDSFWFSGQSGPCGPNTDVLYDLGREYACGKSTCGPTCDCGRFLEIWNAGVFMTYERKADGTLTELPFRSVDAGAGLERFAAVLQGGKSVYDTDIFRTLISEIESLAKITAGEVNQRSVRIIADHVRAATFLASDGLLPSNVEAGYVMRRLIRRAVAHGQLLGIKGYFVSGLSEAVVEQFQDVYLNLAQAHSVIHEVLEDEEKRFGGVLKMGISELNKYFQKITDKIVDGDFSFKLFDSLGFPIDLTVDIARTKGFIVDIPAYERNLSEQKNRSREARQSLAYDPEKIKTAHTAAHLLNSALKTILGTDVHQMGQKIGEKSLRHDFNFLRKLTPEELQKVEGLVNNAISQNLPVTRVETSFEQAKSEGAEALFEEKYQSIDEVTLYKIGPEKATGDYFSKELCGGPHVFATGELKRFKIIKEEAVSAGVRRIRGEVEG